MKNVLYFSVNVLSKKILIGDTILRLLPETGPPILRGHTSHAKVVPLAGQMQYLHFFRP